MRCVFRSHYRDYKLNQAKIDDSQGMCGVDSEYDTCWSRLCSPNRSNVLRDVLRGLLVLIALAIVITIVFLICYFLINDIEKKEEEIVDNLIKDFSAGGRIEPKPEFSTDDVNRIVPDEGDVYGMGDHARGDVDPNKERLQTSDHEPQLIDRIGDDSGAFRNDVPETPDEDKKMASKTELSDGNVAGVPPTTEVSLAGIGGPLAGPFHPDSELDDQTYDVITEFVQADPVNECVPLRLPLCSGSMPWSITAFPNIVNNNNMNQLQESLNYFQSILVGSRCSSRATEYTCAILEPACGPDAIPLPPCRNFCQDIVRTCSEFFVEGNAHNAAFLCDEFPDSENPNVCVDIRRASSDILDAHSTDISDQSPLENPNEPQEVTENPPSGDDFLVDQQSPSNKSVTEKNVDEAIPMTVDSQDKPIDTNLTARTEPPMNKNSTSDPKETASEDTEVETSDMTEPSVFICDHTKFLCTDGSDCLGDESVCDGIQHCLDNSDELNCTKPDCTGDDFSCLTTKYCIPKTWVCDGADDCRDNSDEINCSTKINFGSNPEGEQLLADASDLTPGLFSVIANDNEGGPNAFPNSEQDQASGVNPDSSDLGSFPLNSDVPDEILAGFSKFDGNSQFGTEIIGDVYKRQEPNLDENEESKTEADRAEEEGSTEVTAISDQEGNQEEPENRPERIKYNSRPRRPVRPDRFRLNRRRPTTTESPQEETISENSQTDENQELPEELPEDVPEPHEESGSQTDTTLSGILRRRRPTRITIPTRRLNSPSTLAEVTNNKYGEEQETISDPESENSNAKQENDEQTVFQNSHSEVNTPVDLIGEDSQPETTTYFSFALEENNAQDDRLEDLPSRRPSSLSEILSGSALVAVPNQQPPPIPPSSPKQNRIRVPAPRTLMKGKEQDPSQPFERNAFPSFGPFPFTVKPPTSEKIERPQPSSKLSLAALLSSSSITPVSPPRGNGPQDESPITDFGQEEISPPSQRSLSSLLSSNLPSFSSFPLRRSAQNECREFECNDGSCILLSQVGDGFRDCPDGADENKNIIS